MRFLITLILLSCMSLVMAQSNNSDSKSEEDERRRLENQFKALKNFYINEQGLVVYQAQSDDAKPIERLNENTTGGDTLTILVDNFSDDYNYSLSAAEPINTGTESGRVETSGSNEYTSYPVSGNTSADVVSISKRPVNPVFTHNEAESPKTEEVVSSRVFSAQAIPDESPITPNRIVAIPPAAKIVTEPTPVSNTDIVDNSLIYDEGELEEEVVEDEIPIITTRKSVFEKDPSRYKTLEEAAMAAQDLLDKLKSEQSRTSSSGSLSSRLSRGAGSSSLKKDQSSFSNSFGSGNQNNRPMISEKTIEAEKKFEEASTPYTVEPIPTYYINGIQVDKGVVDKLRKTDILSREVRSRNTESGNPAGEVWIQLK